MAAADLLVLVGGLADPVAYSRWWLPLAVALPVVVVVFYAGVTWRTRKVREPAGRPTRPLSAVRTEHLALLDRLENDVRAGRLTPREAHQRVSRIVRSFVTTVGPVDARTATLADLRADGADPDLPDLADLLGRLYPPSFAPEDEGRPGERLDGALRHARTLVGAWTP
jgi:hypothetical protein